MNPGIPDDGGPAPVQTGVPDLSLRAWLAGQALCGLNAHHGLNLTSEDAARYALSDADAIIKALKGGTEP